MRAMISPMESAMNGGPSGGGEGEHGAEGEHVAGGPDLAAVGLFGGHVGEGADDGAALGHDAAVEGAGDAEVDDTGAVGGEDDVAGFEVAVDEAARVDGGEAFDESGSEGAQVVSVEGAAFGDGFPQGGAGDVGGGHPRRVGGGVGVDDLGGVEAADAAGSFDFTRETNAVFVVVGVFGQDDFDHYRSPSRGAGEEYLPHSSRA